SVLRERPLGRRDCYLALNFITRVSKIKERRHNIQGRDDAGRSAYDGDSTNHGGIGVVRAAIVRPRDSRIEGRSCGPEGGKRKTVAGGLGCRLDASQCKIRQCKRRNCEFHFCCGTFSVRFMGLTCWKWKFLCNNNVDFF
ncbi:hypothetical protein HK096_004237, partial [Nowakowskiella sp. JEL0078]